jgi:hypothetical protein
MSTREVLSDLGVEVRRERECLRVLRADTAAQHIALETAVAQRDQANTLREEFLGELNRIRETASGELKRTERIEGMYTEAEGRLRGVRGELSSAEKKVEIVRTLGVEEERGLQGQRRALRR